MQPNREWEFNFGVPSSFYHFVSGDCEEHSQNMENHKHWQVVFDMKEIVLSWQTTTDNLLRGY